MSVDINYPIPGNTLENSNITYHYWCQKCWQYHDTPWCPNWDYENPFMNDSTPMKVLPYICPHCGQVMWK